MPVKKVECLNPNTGGRINIDADIYQLFTKAIQHTLKGGKALTYTEIVLGVKKYLKDKNIRFEKSVSWYAVSVKLDMQVRGLLEVFTEKGRKYHRLKK